MVTNIYLTPMNTVILFWNPDISSYTMERHQLLLAHDKYECYSFNWSVWEHAQAHSGDRFFMVRCKNKPVPGELNQWGRPLWEPVLDDTTGICMAGHFISEPYSGNDWSGRGRETYYMDMDIHQATDPDQFVIIKSADLLAAMPEFDWKGGHSGRILEASLAAKLEIFYAASLAAHPDLIWTPEHKFHNCIR